MCGIAAMLHRDGEGASREVLARMAEALAHRGPDGEGYYVEGPVGLAHRRLAIVDLATGAQPMASEDGSIRLVCNGEIYNFRELRGELEGRGHRFATQSDNEVIVHLYEEHGEWLAERLRGMFAFARWDAGRGRLVLGRDRFGIKPLYWVEQGGVVAAASEAKALFAVPGVRAALRPECLAEVLLTGCVAGEQSVFRGVRRLLPGHVMVVEGDRLQVMRYWSPPTEIEPGSAQRLGELLEGAVTSHLMSDVPLGLFLSGGLDSATVGALMARQGGQVEAFTARVAGGADEGPAAARAAELVGASWQGTEVGHAEFGQVLGRLVWHHDEPMAFPAAPPLYFVSRLAAARVKVVLTGEGADELLAGYARYPITLANARWGQRWQVLPHSLRQAVAAVGRALPVVGGKLGRTFLGREADPRSLYCENFTGGVSRQAVAGLLGGALYARQDDPFAVALAAWEGGGGDWLAGMMRADLATYLVELLAKQDRMSMAASIESRVPYLDGPLAQYCLRLPARQKLAGGKGKTLLREFAGRLLPPGIAQGPKLGFPVPLADWLRTPLYPWAWELLETLGKREICSPAAIKQAYGEHLGGRDRSELLWRLLNLELWHRAYVDRPEPWRRPQ